MKRKIKVKFVDFHKGLEQHNDFLEILSERYDVVLSDSPDYLFYSVFGMEHLKYNDCVRIFFTGECITPDFNECDYAMGFDRMELGDRYLRVPLYSVYQYRPSYQSLINRQPMTQEELNGKKDFCAFVVSNCFAQEKRVEFFHRLSMYKKVNSGGRFLNNVGGAVADKIAFQQQHKFTIAFENNSYPGYCTEKIVEAFASRTIPIYWGDPTVVEDFDSEAFVNVHDYASLEEVVCRVKEIDGNDELYLSMVNAPIVRQMQEREHLKAFLYHIVEQERPEAMRRPLSRNQLNKEAMILRHKWYEEHVYNQWRRLKSAFKQIENGTILSKKRVP